MLLKLMKPQLKCMPVKLKDSLIYTPSGYKTVMKDKKTMMHLLPKSKQFHYFIDNF